MANWDMFKELDNLRRDIDAAFRGYGYDRFITAPFLSGTRHFPQVNISEDDTNVYLEALVPGVNPNDISMTVVRNTLTVSGERQKSSADDMECIWHRNERGAGGFQRTLELPTEIDTNKVSAVCRNGILTVTMGKSEAAKPKKIAVTVS